MKLRMRPFSIFTSQGMSQHVSPLEISIVLSLYTGICLPLPGTSHGSPPASSTMLTLYDPAQHSSVKESEVVNTIDLTKSLETIPLQPLDEPAESMEAGLHQSAEVVTLPEDVD